MIKKVVISASIILLIILLIIIIFQHKKSYTTVSIKNNVFNLKISDSPREKNRGLMGVKNLKNNDGMIFINKTPQKSYFWMKNTLIPLDIIWVSQENIIIYIQKNTPPCIQEPCRSYGPLSPAKYIIEINGGLCDKYDIRVGDLIKRY